MATPGPPHRGVARATPRRAQSSERRLKPPLLALPSTTRRRHHHLSSQRLLWPHAAARQQAGAAHADSRAARMTRRRPCSRHQRGLPSRGPAAGRRRDEDPRPTLPGAEPQGSRRQICICVAGTPRLLENPRGPTDEPFYDRDPQLPQLRAGTHSCRRGTPGCPSTRPRERPGAQMRGAARRAHAAQGPLQRRARLSQRPSWQGCTGGAVTAAWLALAACCCTLSDGPGEPHSANSVAASGTAGTAAPGRAACAPLHAPRRAGVQGNARVPLRQHVGGSVLAGPHKGHSSHPG